MKPHVRRLVAVHSVWLLRVNDTALHREWLQTAVDGFLTRQHCEGTWCAFKEELSHSGWGKSTRSRWLHGNRLSAMGGFESASIVPH